MDKDKILDNNERCEQVECFSEDGLCDVGGGTNFKDKLKTNLVVAYGAPNRFPKLPIVKYGAPKTFENKELKDLADNKSTKEE